MTRKEIIDLAAYNTYNVSNHRDGMKSFRDGAMWADENPNWHKYPDEVPPKPDFFVAPYLVFTESGDVLNAWWTGGYFKVLCFDIETKEPYIDEYAKVVAWLGVSEDAKTITCINKPKDKVLEAMEQYRFNISAEEKSKDLERLEECQSNVVIDNNIVNYLTYISDIIDNEKVWHNYPDEKPPIADEYIVAFDNGNVYTAHYIKRNDKWTDKDIADNCAISKVIAWAEFPKHPNTNRHD